MIKSRPKKILFKIVGFLALAIFLFSCRGITPAKFTGHIASTAPGGHPNCCTSFGEKWAINNTHPDLTLGIIIQKNIMDPSGPLEILFVSIGIITAIVVYKKYHSYIKSIRGRYGSFTLLNYFTNLFSQGLLNAKAF